MRILFVGDVVGKTGRAAVSEHLPGLRESLDLDFVVVNGENAAHGFGITDRSACPSTSWGPTSSPPATMSGTSARS